MKINPKIKEDLKDYLMEKIQKEQGLVTVFSADYLDSEEKNALYREVKNKIVRTSLMVVEKALKESLDESSRKQVTNFIIKNYDGKLKVYEN